MNARYLDRNDGGILLVRDHIFGSFEEEEEEKLDEARVYGKRSPVQSWDPLWANAQARAALAHDSWCARRWRDKLCAWWRPPVRRPADVAKRFPKLAFEIGAVARYEPVISARVQIFAAAPLAKPDRSAI